jgi:hypothetical protein
LRSASELVLAARHESAPDDLHLSFTRSDHSGMNTGATRISKLMRPYQEAGVVLSALRMRYTRVAWLRRCRMRVGRGDFGRK